MRASKSISQRKGLWAEHVVCRLLLRRQWVFGSHRKKIEGVEIDLQFFKDHQIVFFEVKYLDDLWRAFERIQKSQVERLRRTLFHLRLLEKRKASSKKVSGFLVFVDKNQSMKFLSIDDLN